MKEAPTGHPEKILCQIIDDGHTSTIEIETENQIFPDYNKIVPNFKDPLEYQRISINGHYLKEVCSLLEKYEATSNRIYLYIKRDDPTKGIKDGYSDSGANFPLVVTADDQAGTTATAVICQLRI